MTKESILFAALIFNAQSYADMKFNTFTQQFYSTPLSIDINQQEYDSLHNQISNTILQFMNRGIYGSSVRNHIIVYLNSLKSPTASRLLADYEKCWGK